MCPTKWVKVSVLLGVSAALLVVTHLRLSGGRHATLEVNGKHFGLDLNRSQHNYTTRHLVKGCELVHRPAKYHSQSEEDRALYQRYFSKPDVCGGVYLEIGALDGVKYSNTKFFEDHLNWNGILIEANPENAALLKRNRPKSLVIPKAVCNASEKFVEFAGSAAVGGILKEMPSSHIHRFIPDKSTIKVPCEPIGQMIRDSGFRAIDLFVLDVEGAELMVLRTMDWSILVRVFVVEMGRGDRDRQLVNLLHQHGYRNATWNIRDYCRPGKDCANNMVFENPQFLYQISS